MAIVVTGAGGRLSHRVAELLLAARAWAATENVAASGPGPGRRHRAVAGAEVAGMKDDLRPPRSGAYRSSRSIPTGSTGDLRPDVHAGKLRSPATSGCDSPAGTSASGALKSEMVGSAVPADRSDEAEGADEIVVVTRRPEAVVDLAAAGAVVRAGDFDDPVGLVEAFAGAQRLLLVSTDALDRRVVQHHQALEAAVTAGVEHVVYTSLSNPVPDNPVRSVTDAHRHTEDALVDLVPQWTILRNATYADALLPLWLQATAAGRLVTSQGEGRTAWVARDDCAAVAAAVLTGGPAEHAGRVYDVTGPALVGAADLADTLAAWSDRAVGVEPIDDEAMAIHMVATGIPEDQARLVAIWHRAVRDGWFAQHTDVVESLTGRPARPIAALLP